LNAVYLKKATRAEIDALIFKATGNTPADQLESHNRTELAKAWKNEYERRGHPLIGCSKEEILKEVQMQFGAAQGSNAPVGQEIQKQRAPPKKEEPEYAVLLCAHSNREFLSNGLGSVAWIQDCKPEEMTGWQIYHNHDSEAYLVNSNTNRTLWCDEVLPAEGVGEQLVSHGAGTVDTTAGARQIVAAGPPSAQPQQQYHQGMTTHGAPPLPGMRKQGDGSGSLAIVPFDAGAYAKSKAASIPPPPPPPPVQTVAPHVESQTVASIAKPPPPPPPASTLRGLCRRRSNTDPVAPAKSAISKPTISFPETPVPDRTRRRLLPGLQDITPPAKPPPQPPKRLPPAANVGEVAAPGPVLVDLVFYSYTDMHTSLGLMLDSELLLNK